MAFVLFLEVVPVSIADEVQGQLQVSQAVGLLSGSSLFFSPPQLELGFAPTTALVLCSAFCFLCLLLEVELSIPSSLACWLSPIYHRTRQSSCRSQKFALRSPVAAPLCSDPSSLAALYHKEFEAR